jgi:GntR family transcriptional regulator of vanillate catabolism
VAEIPLSRRLGVSRTPIRLAFRALEHEGLLRKAGARGYMVREISPGEIAGAIEVRGVLEGLAARLMAERGASREDLTTLQECLDAGDAIFEKGHITEEDVAAYHDMNMRFHEVVVRASANAALANALERNDSFPFASVNSIAVDRERLDKEFQRLHFAHLQHHVIVDAIRNGQGARAEDAMREHANAAMRYAEVFGAAAPPPENFQVLLGGRSGAA